MTAEAPRDAGLLVAASHAVLIVPITPELRPILQAPVDRELPPETMPSRTLV